MKPTHATLTRLTALLLAGVMMAHPAHGVAGAFGAPEDEGFSNSVPLDDSELSQVRGGFALGGLVIDFALTTRTVIDGVVESQATLSSANLNVAAENLRQVIQIGEANQNALQQLNVNNGILTVIQNSLDNKTIQTQNILDITAAGVNQFQQDTAVNASLEYQNVISIR